MYDNLNRAVKSDTVLCAFAQRPEISESSNPKFRNITFFLMTSPRIPQAEILQVLPKNYFFQDMVKSLLSHYTIWGPWASHSFSHTELPKLLWGLMWFKRTKSSWAHWSNFWTTFSPLISQPRLNLSQSFQKRLVEKFCGMCWRKKNGERCSFSWTLTHDGSPLPMWLFGSHI